MIRPLAVASLLLPLLAPDRTRAEAPRWDLQGTVRAMAAADSTVYLAGDFWGLTYPAPDGVIVAGPDGSLRWPPRGTGGPRAWISASAPDGAGGFFVAGEFDTFGGQPRSGLAHLLADGTIAAWNPGPVSDVRALAIRGETLFVGGNFASIGGQPRACLAAVNQVTGEILAWNPGVDGVVSSFAMGADVLYVGGGFTHVAGRWRPFLAALDPGTGTPTDWNPNADGYVTCLTLDRNELYVGGYFGTIGGKSRHMLAALDVPSASATGWDPTVVLPPYNPSGSSNVITGIAVTPTTVFVGGYFSAVGGQPRNGIGALDRRTGRATSWQVPLHPGYMGYEVPVVLAVAVHGPTVYVGGIFWGPYGYSPSNFVAVDTLTAEPVRWALETDLAVASIPFSGDALLLGGTFRQLWLSRPGLAALDSRTGVALSWDPGMRGRGVNAIAVVDNSVVLGGDFDDMGGRARNYLAAVDGRSGRWAYHLREPDAPVHALAASGPVIYVGGSFTHIGGDARAHLAAVHTSGSRMPWDPGADGPVEALALEDGVVYAAGEFAHAGGLARRRAAALDAVSGAVTPWDPRPDGAVHALVPFEGRIFAGGEFHEIGGQPREFLASLDGASGGALPWNPGADAPVRALAPGRAWVYAGGDFSHAGGEARDHVAAIGVDDGRLSPWSPGADSSVSALAVAGAHVVLGGKFTRVGAQASRGFAIAPAASPSVLAAPPSAVAAVAFAPCLPNPAREVVRLRFSLAASSPVRIAVHDLQGRLVRVAFESAARPPGTVDVPLDVAGWRAGVYLCRLTAGRASITRKLVVVP